MKKQKHWYDYLWIWTALYFTLGFFNILFAWLGMIDFLLPLGFAVFGGNKLFCNRLCGRGQLCMKLGGQLKCSRNKPTPPWMYSKWFRYGFLAFFLAMFGNMLFQTWLVAAGAASLREADLSADRTDCHGALQAADLVYLLSNGYHDPGDLQAAAQTKIEAAARVSCAPRIGTVSQTEYE